MPKARVAFITSHGQKMRDYVASFLPPGVKLTCIDQNLPDEKKLEELKSAEYIIVHPPTLSDKVLQGAKHIKLIQLLSAGYDGVNLKLARELGIPVANNGGANSITVSEHTIMLILAVYRNLMRMANNAKAGAWRDLEQATLNAFELAGKTVGLVGMGNVAREVAKRLKGFDVTVQYYDKYVTLQAEVEKELAVKKVPLEQLMRTSDVISCHIPLTSETRQLIGRDQIAMMKPSAIFINTSRGGIVDQRALYEALRDRKIWAAGLDVLDPEPFDRNEPILRLENATVTPHSAGFVYDSYRRRAANAFENIQRVHRGEKPKWIAQFV